MHHVHPKMSIEAESTAFTEASIAGDDTVEGSQEIYESKVLKAKEAASPGRRQSYRGSLPLGRHNLSKGVNALADEKEEVEKRDGVTIAGFQKLLELVPALAFALSLKRRLVPSPSETPGLVQEAYGFRRLLLKSLDAVTEKGLVPALHLERIRPGSGHLDLVKDLVDLVAIFREQPEVFAHRTPVEPADLARADELARMLQMVIKPKGATEPAAKPAELVEIETIIDGLWTLIVEGHKEMRRSAFLLWDEAFDEHVPALLSRERAKKKVVVEDAPEPEAASV